MFHHCCLADVPGHKGGSMMNEDETVMAQPSQPQGYTIYGIFSLRCINEEKFTCMLCKKIKQEFDKN